MIEITLNGKNIAVEENQTILKVAQENGIGIPTLCHDQELEPFGSCWVCAVKVDNRKGFVTACGTKIEPGMRIITNSEEVLAARKMALELLISDHYADCEAPCKIACPAKVDVQTYLSLIANGEYHEAVKVIKETLPMPLSIGRICPAFCESECRRQIVDEPIAIRQLKRHAADFDLLDKFTFIPTREAAKKKKIAVVGSGPAGLTCGYYLSNKGYIVNVYESAAEAGGWLRYGIPEFRLPKKILDKEIKLLCKNGMTIFFNKQIGKDIYLSKLSAEYDAVFLAIGAQKSVPLRLKGDNLAGVYLGGDYLKTVAEGKPLQLQKKIAVIGGGNTAVDCARTSIRLGYEVTVIYRRTKVEMPAEPSEVKQAEEEGVKFCYLINPVEFIGKKGKLKSIKFEKMSLGNADSSGRRRPEPTGEFFTEEFGSVICAISQIPEVNFLTKQKNLINGSQLPLSAWSTAQTDEDSLYTNVANIFAGGDFRRGPATAVEAIADGRIAAQSIDNYLHNRPLTNQKEKFNSIKDINLKNIEHKFYENYEKIERHHVSELPLKKRVCSFEEVEIGFDDEQAIAEASRCIECGCFDNETCDLRKYCTEYSIDSTLFLGEKNKHPIDNSHPFIQRDPNKCIKCGRCIRTCAEIQGPGVLGFIYRGFETYVAPEFSESLSETTCESCGKCIEVCPTGSLTPKNVNFKLNPHLCQITEQNCGLCGTGCKIAVHTQNNNILQITPAGTDFNGQNLCFDGKFGWQIFDQPDRILQPYQREDDIWIPADMDFVTELVAEKLATAQTKKIYVSPACSLEELLIMKEISRNINADLSTLTYKKSFVHKLRHTNLMNLTYDDLEYSQAIVIVGKISHTLKILSRYWQKKGKKLIIISNSNNDFQNYADELLNDYPPAETLDKIMEYYYNEDDERIGEDFGNEEKPNDPIELDLPEKTIFLYDRCQINELTIWRIWALAAMICDFKKGSGVLPTSQFNNFRGLMHLNIKPGKPENSDFVLLYGELPCEEQKKLMKNSRFILSVNTHLDNADPSHFIIPKPSFLDMKAISLANDGRISYFENPRNSRLLNILLENFCNSGMIDKKMTSPEFWNKKALLATKEASKIQHLSNQELYDFLDTVENVNLETTKTASVQRKLITKLKKQGW
jgi:formate dehydrogenase major subunit